MIKIPKDENKSPVVSPQGFGDAHFVTYPEEDKYLKDHKIPKLKKLV